jgi:hypothetical protein
VVVGKGKDPYNYKLDDKNNYYYIKKTDYAKNPNAWILAKDENVKNAIKNKYFTPFTTKTKTDIVKGKGYPYTNLKTKPTVQLISDVIKGSKGSGMFSNDKEAWAEAAFMAIPNKKVYNKVSKVLGEDPYYFIRSFMNPDKVYHQKSINDSMKRIIPNFQLVGDYSRDANNVQNKIAGVGTMFKSWFRRTFPNVAEMFFSRDLKSSDFNSSQKQEIIDAVGRSINRTGQNKGSIEYVDYGDNVVNKWFGPGGVKTGDMISNTVMSNPKFMVATTLGRFSYDLQGKRLHVTDIYDFKKIDDVKTTEKELEGLSYPQKIAKIVEDNNVNPYLAVRHLAYLEHPDTDPKSKPKIDIQLDLA